MRRVATFLLAMMAVATTEGQITTQRRATPDRQQLQQSFGKTDEQAFLHPDRIFYPETWFHFLNGSIRREGITQDLEAIAASGIQGVQFFHGQVGNPADWPGTEEHIECLSPKWEELVRHTADEAHRLGLRFSLQTCPGWATSGGPWIKPEQAMRHLSYTQASVTGGSMVDIVLPTNQKEAWRDWRDIAVLAFPTPQGDTPAYCQAATVDAAEGGHALANLLLGGSGQLGQCHGGDAVLDVDGDGHAEVDVADVA